MAHSHRAGLAQIMLTALLLAGSGAAGLSLHAWAASWEQNNYNLSIPTHFNATAQAQIGSVALTLSHGDNDTINASASQAGGEVLTHTTTGDTMATHYKLTGENLASPDQTWVSSSDFIDPGRSYILQGSATSQITLHAKATSASGRANDTGTYNGSITLTVSW